MAIVERVIVILLTLVACACFYLAAFLLPLAEATGFFVDPTTGLDTNNGLTEDTPWKTIPGTRNVGDTDFLNVSWGAVSSGNKLVAGDIVFLKGGETHTSTEGGVLLLDDTFYTLLGVGQSPITIQVSPTWGTGNFTFDGTGMTSQTNIPMILVSGRDRTHLKGVDATRRMVLQNGPSGSDWQLIVQGSGGDHVDEVELHWLEVKDGKSGIDISFADDCVIADTLVHDNTKIGLTLGGINDQNTDNCEIRDVTANDNGTVNDGSGIQHGIGIYAATNLTMLRVVAHTNTRDGVDIGTTGNDEDVSVTVTDSTFRDNGEDGLAISGGTGTQTMVVNRSIAWDNGDSGFRASGGVSAEFYHCVSSRNGPVGSAFGGNFFIFGEPPGGTTTAKIRNSISWKPEYAHIFAFQSQGETTTIDSDFNIYVPKTDDNDTFAELPFGTAISYANASTIIGPNDRAGAAFDPNFTDDVNDDYTLTLGSIAIDTGIATDNNGLAFAGLAPDLGASEFLDACP
jgi:hypothetical protein